MQVVEAPCPRCLAMTQTAMHRQFPALYAPSSVPYNWGLSSLCLSCSFAVLIETATFCGVATLAISISNCCDSRPQANRALALPVVVPELCKSLLDV